MNYNEACERAAEQIREDLKAGAVSDYMDGDSALEYLGGLIKLQQKPRNAGEDVQVWYNRILALLDIEIQRIIDSTVENNVHFVAEQIARNV